MRVSGVGPHSDCLMLCLQVPQVEWSASSCRLSCRCLWQLRQLPASRVLLLPPEAWQSEQGVRLGCHQHPLVSSVSCILPFVRQLGYVDPSAIASTDELCSSFSGQWSPSPPVAPVQVPVVAGCNVNRYPLQSDQDAISHRVSLLTATKRLTAAGGRCSLPTMQYL